MNFDFLKITAPTIFHQRFKPGTLRFESQCSSTELSWDRIFELGTVQGK